MAGILLPARNDVCSTLPQGTTLLDCPRIGFSYMLETAIQDPYRLVNFDTKRLAYGTHYPRIAASDNNSAYSQMPIGYGFSFPLPKIQPFTTLGGLARNSANRSVRRTWGLNPLLAAFAGRAVCPRLRQPRHFHASLSAKGRCPTVRN